MRALQAAAEKGNSLISVQLEAHLTRSRLFSVALVFVAAIAAVLGVPVLGFAQTDQATAGPQTTLVNVNEVTLDLVARSKNGKVVSDLEPEDIAVSDGGVPVKISHLRRVSADSKAHLLTFMFDRLDSAASQNARSIAEKILKLLPERGFSLCVMKAQGRLTLYQEFTSDTRALHDAVTAATNEEDVAKTVDKTEKRVFAMAQTGKNESGTQVQPETRATARMLLAALLESQRFVQDLHTQPGLAGLMALAKAEQKKPGRKTVVYFAQGTTSDSSSGDRLREVVGSANRAGMSIYVVDVNALTAQTNQNLLRMMVIGNVKAVRAQTPPPATVGTGTNGAMQSLPQDEPGLAPMVANQLDRYESDLGPSQNPLAALTESTGGAYVPAGGDLKKPIRQLIEDMTTYYEAFYTPPIQNYDGHFRPIEVKPVRKGLKVSSRAGYFALPPGSEQTIQPFEAPLLKVFDQPQLSSEIAFEAKVLQLGEFTSGNENALVVEIPLGSLETRDDPNTNLYSLHVSIVAQVRDKSGTVVEHFSEDVPHHGKLGAEGDKTGSITMQRHFTAEPGTYSLEVAILDHNAGKTGAQRIPFEVTGPANGFFLSDLSMVQRIDAMPDAVDLMDPMRYGDGRVVPQISQKVSLAAKEISFFFIVHTQDSAVAPRLEMELRRNGKAMARSPLTLSKTSGGAILPYLTSIQTAALAAGNYEVVERLTQGESSAERKLSFQIQGTKAIEEANDAVGASQASDGTTADIEMPAGATASGHSVVIRSLPDNASSALTPDQLQSLVEETRKWALDYGKMLPNFLCVEITNRSVDANGTAAWKPRDTIAELLTYHQGIENRSTLEINGKRSSLARAQMNTSWPLSVGEFGAILNVVFKPTSKAQFQWKEAATLGDGSGILQVLSYQVAAKDATIVLNSGSDQFGAGFHGLVYVDGATGGIRRIILYADGIPSSFAIRAATMTVDYEYVAISGRDYLLPVRSTVTLARRHKKMELNEMSFRNYRRYASRSKVTMVQ